MAIVDTHCHASPDWFEPIESLLFQMDTCGVDKAVLVQHGGEYDNAYLLTCAEQHSGRFAVTGLVDTKLPDARKRWPPGTLVESPPSASSHLQTLAVATPSPSGAKPPN